MDETIYVIFKVQFDFALEVWFSIERFTIFLNWSLKLSFPTIRLNLYTKSP